MGACIDRFDIESDDDTQSAESDDTEYSYISGSEHGEESHQKRISSFQ